MLDYLRAKPAAFRVIDTHAGAGLYDLAGVEASRGGEWHDGIARLMAAHLAAPVADLDTVAIGKSGGCGVVGMNQQFRPSFFLP